MNYNELKEDLINKTPSYYFNHKLFKNEIDVYSRRSFDDLFKYYRFKGVTEKMLLNALVECGFVAKVCANLKKVIFYRDVEARQDHIYWSNINGSGSGYTHCFNVQNSKYTFDYLNSLLD